LPTVSRSSTSVARLQMNSCTQLAHWGCDMMQFRWNRKTSPCTSHTPVSKQVRVCRPTDES
jgi:hypothetical protein